ncbi:MAG: PKD domain-containing protein, partial [Thermoanaerobaculia bacterium]|nr:PKD domain-containing protein [Thermoanaerobaculia bacterium]
MTVQFTSTSSANAVNYNWLFPGGNPSNSALQNPVVAYNAPGTYSVTLIVSNSAGSDTTTLSNYITVNPGPTAGFTSTTNGATATFTNTSTNGVSYNWDFGDGGSSNAQNPTHTYATDGTYTVTLTATNPCGTSTSSQTVVIVTPPTAGFTATPTSGCGPLT